MLLLFIAAAALHVVDTSKGCFHRQDGSGTFQRVGDQYVDATRKVPVEAVQRLRANLVESTRFQTFDPALLGVTPQSVLENRNKILRAAQLDPSAPLPLHVAERLSFERVAEVARHRLTARDASTTSVAVSITLDGKDGFSVSSSHQTALMLPWQVTIGGRTFTTYSVEVSRAVADVLGDSGNRRLVADSAYWRDRFWTDVEWSWDLKDAAASDDGADRARTMSGFDEMSRRFELSRQTVRDDLLSVVLKPRTEGWFLYVYWSTDARTASWTDLLRRVDEADRFLSGTTWMPSWMADGSRRFVKAWFGARRDPLVLAAWKEAGFRGEPDLKLEVSGVSMTSPQATIYMGRSESRVLISAVHDMPGVEGASRGVWLVGRSPEYLVGDAQGRWHRRTLRNPPSSPTLGR